MNPIRIGILGYGNLGRGIELAVAANDDMELVGVFTRRDPASVHPLGENVAVWPATELAAHTDDIDVLVLAGGSATDLPEQTPAAAALYNVVDSFDTHANIPAHFAAVDAVARETGHVAVISVGWDPGMFSVSRVYANAIMPNGADYTFWGRGVSQGHSDAIRRIPGVADARQYTVPVPEALEAVRSGANPELTTRQKHSASSWPRRAPIRPPSKRPSSPCRTTSPTTTPRSPSFLRKSSTAITPAFPTAARSSAPAPRVPPARTPM